MRIVEVYSHMNGLEFLLVHHAARWEEIQGVVAAVDAAVCLTKESKERGRIGNILYSPVDMNAAFKGLLTERGWSEERTAYWVTANQKLIRQTMHLPESEQRAEIEAGSVPPTPAGTAASTPARPGCSHLTLLGQWTYGYIMTETKRIVQRGLTEKCRRG